MKDARSILEKAYGLGLDLTADEDGRLRIGATIEPPPPELMDALKAHKGAVLALLQSIPVYSTGRQQELSSWAAIRPRPERLAMHHRGMAIRRDRGWPFHVAQFAAMDEAEGIRRE